jgi:predicted amidohydrolase YtcJ
MADAGPAGAVPLAGFVDHHAHLLRDSAGIGFPWQQTSVRSFHEQVASDGSTPMDITEPDDDIPPGELDRRLYRGLARAAQTGLVEVTEMGVRGWAYLAALDRLQRGGPLPVRIRLYLASGLAEQATPAELRARRADCGPWVRLDGVKFYADGWLVPRTCALCEAYADSAGTGLLFMTAATLARRIEPLAEDGWRIATHAIGDRAIATVLDAYDMVWGSDRRAIGAAMPRIEHGSVLSAELADRIAETGVTVCIQPSFPVTDAGQIPVALGPGRAAHAYPWAVLAAAGCRMLLGSDYPIEVIEPLVGLARLVAGRSDRAGYATECTAAEHSRLPLPTAIALATDAAAGRTLLSADAGMLSEPALAGSLAADRLDRIAVLGTSPVPFDAAGPSP